MNQIRTLVWVLEFDPQDTEAREAELVAETQSTMFRLMIICLSVVVFALSVEKNWELRESQKRELL